MKRMRKRGKSLSKESKSAKEEGCESMRSRTLPIPQKKCFCSSHLHILHLQNFYDSKERKHYYKKSKE